mgnify:CR=1 FL=1
MPTPYEPATISYSEDVKGWPSFYSFLPDFMMGMNGFFYTWSGGNLYRHNTNALRNNYYGVQYNSTITSVFNFEPMTIKLFKTMSYESNDRWECPALFSDLGTGSMLQTFFEQKEGEWFTFLRENAGTLDFRDRSTNGIGVCTNVSGPPAALLSEFGLQDIGSILSVGDAVYFVAPSTPPATSGAPTYGGVVTNIVRQSTTTVAGVTTPASITINTVVPPGAIPPIGDFICFVKDAVAESHGARGYFLNFTLTNNNTEAVELFSVGSSVMKSFP